MAAVITISTESSKSLKFLLLPNSFGEISEIFFLANLFKKNWRSRPIHLYRLSLKVTSIRQSWTDFQKTFMSGLELFFSYSSFTGAKTTAYRSLIDVTSFFYSLLCWLFEAKSQLVWLSFSWVKVPDKAVSSNPAVSQLIYSIWRMKCLPRLMFYYSKYKSA